MDKKIRIGFIGTGGIANGHIKAYIKRDDVEIVAGCDIVPGKAEAFFKGYGLENVRCYESHQEMLEKEELDGVSICTYNAQHAGPAIDALNKGLLECPEMPHAETLTIMRQMDALRAQWHMVYPFD